MSRVLILGGRGRLGAALAREWSKRHEVRSLARPEVDASDLPGLESILQTADYEVLVNCIAQTNVDGCERDPAEAWLINDRAVGVMAQAANQAGARLIHISTDYVFDGAKKAPYVETDEARPISEYGASKLAGEKQATEASSRHVVARVSWVFGPDKPSFIDMLLDRARDNDQAAAIADKTACPSYTVDIADWLEAFLEPTAPGGIYHATNAGGCSWQEYGQEALDIAHRLGYPLRARTVAPLTLESMSQFVARRPVHTVLSSAKLTAVTGREPRAWQEALADYLTQKFSS